jgi:hypothetical protein
MKATITFSFIFLTVFIYSCSSDVKQTDSAESIEVQEESASISEDIPDESPSFILPSAFHVSSLLQRAGLEFEGIDCNSADNIALYNTKNSRLLNFGVYSADLFFCVLKDEKDLSKQYIKCLQQISEETGMGSIFNAESILERFEQNIENKDSVLSLILEVQKRTDMHVERSNEEHTAMLIFCGAWLEGMHLGLNNFQQNKNLELGKRLFEQACLLENLIVGLSAYPDPDETTQSLLAEMERVFASIKETEAFQKGDYGLIETPLPESAMMKISSNLNSLRNQVTLNEDS